MSLADLSSREAVLSAIAEYDQVGQPAFLRKHRFGPSREYVLVFNGTRYDSKAIAGAAYGYQYPDRPPLRPGDFSGGAQTTDRLRALGFEVEAMSSAAGGNGPASASLSDLLEQILQQYEHARTSEPFGGQS